MNKALISTKQICDCLLLWRNIKMFPKIRFWPLRADILLVHFLSYLVLLSFLFIYFCTVTKQFQFVNLCSFWCSTSLNSVLYTHQTDLSLHWNWDWTKKLSINHWNCHKSTHFNRKLWFHSDVVWKESKVNRQLSFLCQKKYSGLSI